jgi:biotin carboxyl carrier protein
MKMENEVLCDYDGRIVSVSAFAGQSVSEGDELMTLDIG